MRGLDKADAYHTWGELRDVLFDLVRYIYNYIIIVCPAVYK